MPVSVFGAFATGNDVGSGIAGDGVVLCIAGAIDRPGTRED